MKIAITNPQDNYMKILCKLGAEVCEIETEVDPLEYDGLLLPGGGDINPERYGQTMNGSHRPDDELDAIELKVLSQFILAGKPVFGICRGCQLINVFFGGNLIQDLQNAVEHTKIGKSDNKHDAEAVTGSFIDEIYGAKMTVNSAHHQAIKDLGEGLVVAQRAGDGEGTIEAIAHRTKPIWAVQWHPERMCDTYPYRKADNGEKIFEFFLDQCKNVAK